MSLPPAPHRLRAEVDHPDIEKRQLHIRRGVVRGPSGLVEKHQNARRQGDRYCELYLLPVIADLPCRELTRDDFQLILDKAPTKSVAAHIKSCLTGMVNAGLDEGHLLARQDLLRGVRWHGGLDDGGDDEPVDHAVTWEEIPTVDALHALALRTAERAGDWWRELQLLLVAYSGAVG